MICRQNQCVPVLENSRRSSAIENQKIHFELQNPLLREEFQMATQRFGQTLQHGDYRVSIQSLPGYMAWTKAKGPRACRQRIAAELGFRTISTIDCN